MNYTDVPPMIPLQKLREMRKSDKNVDSIRKSIRSSRTETKIEKKPFKLKGVEGVYAGAIFPLEGKTIIGRNPGESNIIYPAETPGISRKHCALIDKGDGMLLITDLGSSQGTFFTDGTKLAANVVYRIERGECFYLASRNETYKVI